MTSGGKENRHQSGRRKGVARRRLLAGWLLIAALLIWRGHPEAREFSLLGGEAVGTDDLGSSYSWQMEYRERLGRHFSLSFSYVNEGHLVQNHRDGDTLQLWVGTDTLGDRLHLSAGAGPYYYLNTEQRASGSDAYSNEHGVGGIFSLAMAWRASDRWLLQLRGNMIHTVGSFDSLTVVAGLGYRFADPARTEQLQEGSTAQGPTKRNEIALFGGQAIVNSFSSQQSMATALEYRLRVTDQIDWSAGWLHEGNNPLLRRYGLTSQLWIARRFLHEMLELGVGGGAYLALAHRVRETSTPGESNALSGVLSFTAGYCLDSPWYLRANWHRVITNYDRDADVILGGIGYRF